MRSRNVLFGQTIRRGRVVSVWVNPFRVGTILPHRIEARGTRKSVAKGLGYITESQKKKRDISEKIALKVRFS